MHPPKSFAFLDWAAISSEYEGVTEPKSVRE